ncbi:hypothetical protein [Ralstonia pseudosolanacearum]|uniref:hypothetical protein n=1 Tax=Ralstonia pseudosolanacearum TaxID=1310165 RepID=UPI003CF73DB6
MFGLDEQFGQETPGLTALNGDLGNQSSGNPASEIDWICAMESLRTQNAWGDADLSAAISLSTSMINQCRSGRRPLPPSARIRVLSHLGFEITRDRLLSVVPDEIREAVLEADASSAFTRSALVDRFLDELDEMDSGRTLAGSFLQGLADLSGKPLHDLGRSLNLSAEETDRVCAGRLRLPFRAKRAITEKFGGNELGSLIVRLSVA